MIKICFLCTLKKSISYLRARHTAGETLATREAIPVTGLTCPPFGRVPPRLQHPLHLKLNGVRLLANVQKSLTSNKLHNMHISCVAV